MFDCLCCPLNGADKHEFDNRLIPSAFLKKSLQETMIKKKNRLIFKYQHLQICSAVKKKKDLK